MADTLTWNLRTSTIYAHVSGRVTGLAVDPADPASDRIWTWEKVQELRTGQWSATDHTFRGPSAHGKGYVLTSVSHGARTSHSPIQPAGRLTIVGIGAAFLGDYRVAPTTHTMGGDPDQPVVLGSLYNASRAGAYPPPPPPGTGPVPIPYPNLSAARTNSAPFFDPGFDGGIFVATPGRGVIIHPWPPRIFPGPTIVVRAGWRALAEAVQMTQPLTLIAEI